MRWKRESENRNIPSVGAMATCVKIPDEDPIFFRSVDISAHLALGFWYKSLNWPDLVTHMREGLFAGWNGPSGVRRTAEYAHRPLVLIALWKTCTYSVALSNLI